MAAYDDLNVKRIFIVGVISCVVVAVTALAVQVVAYSMLQWQQESKSAQSDYRRQNSILSAQKDQISSFGVDPDTGNITIPIDKAIELVAQEAHQTDSNDKASQADEI